jgi:hypothetical protein
MKKSLAILLSVVYLAVTSGVAMTVHYCMGEVAAVGLGHSESDKCGDCGMENSGCCHDDFKVVKVSDYHGWPSQPAQAFKSDCTSAQPVPVVPSLRSVDGHLLPGRISHAPPDAADIPLRILHCVYRI